MKRGETIDCFNINRISVYLGIRMLFLKFLKKWKINRKIRWHFIRRGVLKYWQINIKNESI